MLDGQSSIHGIFERVAKCRPEAVAVKYKNTEITYKELNLRANFLAKRMQVLGVKPGDIVAIELSHSVELMVSIIAILKCGAAYLPLDGNNPQIRNEQYLTMAGVSVIICADISATDYYQSRTCVSIEDKPLFSTMLENFDAYQAVPDDKAYVMFTSGSTGSPKGVIVPHRAVIRLVIDTNYIQITAQDSILQFAPPSFDASTFEIWGALLNGATSVLYSGSGLDPNLLKAEIHNNGVTVMWLTAALFHLITDKFIDILRTLRVLLAGGDVLNPKYINKTLDTFDNITVINGYGPTENTTFTCCHVMTSDNRPQEHVLIGKPISGTEVYLLDDKLRPVTRGEIGELFTSGAGVALGYIGDTASQNNAFFEHKVLGLIYRTGDLARENEQGKFEFIGRKDNQVKIRGFRVSLEEIKTKIVELPNVIDAVVVTEKFDSGDQLLEAYIQLEAQTQCKIKDMKSELARSLPAYMVPDRLMISADLPINKNGKIDRKKFQTKSFLKEKS